MDYNIRLAVVDEVSKKMTVMQKSIDGTLDVVKDMQKKLDELPGSQKRLGDETERTEKKTKGLLKEIFSINRTMRRTTALFGAAFSIGQISQFTNEFVDAEQSIASGFGLTGAALSEATRNAQKLATTYKVDVADSIATAKTISEQFGVSGEESFSLIQSALSKGVSADFLGNVQALAPAFRQAGLSADSALATIIQAERSGVGSEVAAAYQEAINKISTLDGQGVGDALKVFGIDKEALQKNLNEGKITIAQAMQEIVARYEDMGDKSVEAQGALNALFGDGAANISRFLVNTDAATMSIAGMEDRTTEATRAQQYLLGAWADFKLFITDNVVPAMVQVVGWVKENQTSLIYWGSLALKVAGAFAGIWLAAKSLMLVKGMVGTITAGFSTLSMVLRIAQGATLLFNAALWANPIGLVVAAIAGIGVAVYGLITYWDTVVSWLGWASDLLWTLNPLSWITYFIDYIFPGFQATMQGVYDNLTWPFKKAGEFIDAWFIQPVKAGISKLMQWLGLAKKEAKAAKGEITGETMPEVKDTAPMLANQFGLNFNAGFNEQNGFAPGKGKSHFDFGGIETPGPKAGTGKNLGISAGIAGVQSEGPKAQNLYITINKMIEQMVFNTTNLNESTAKIKEEVAKVLLASVNDVNASVG